MMFINKKEPPVKVKRLLAEKISSPEWSNIKEDDTDALRMQFDTLNKSDIRKSLLDEQHNICAYCMKRISDSGLHTTIEHVVPISRNKSKALDYSNFICVCKGGADVQMSSKKVLCCDGSKGEEEIKVSPLNKAQMDNIEYSKDGFIIYKGSPDIQEEIDYILCLNGKRNRETGEFVCDTSTQLVKGRKDTYIRYKMLIENLDKKKQLTSRKIMQIISDLQRKEEYDEFIGVMLFFLKRKYKVLLSCGK